MLTLGRPLTLLLLLSGVGAQPASKNQSDAHGDPLPPGAIARLGSLRLRYQHEWGLPSLSWSPDGSKVVTAGYLAKERLVVWDAKTGARVVVLTEKSWKAIRKVAYSPCGTKIAAASQFVKAPKAHQFAVWDSGTGKLIRSFVENAGEILDLQFADGGKTVVTVDCEGYIYWWDVESGKRVRSWERPDKLSYYWTSAALSPDATRLAASVALRDLGDKERQATATLWDITANKALWQVKDRCQSDRHFAFAPDGKWVALTGEKGRVGQVEVRETANGKVQSQLEAEVSHWDALAFAPDGKSLGILVYAQKVLVWDWQGNKAPRRLSLQPAFLWADSGASLGFSPNGKIVAVSFGNSVHLHEVDTGKEAIAGLGTRIPVTHLAFSDQGKKLFAGGDYHQTRPFPLELRTWDTSKWQQTSLSCPETWDLFASFSLDHRLCLENDKGKWIIRERATAKVQSVLELGGDEANVACFAPNGQLLVVGAEFGQFWLVDAKTGKTLGVLPNYKLECPVDFSPTNSAVAWYGNDGVIRVFDVIAQKVVFQLGEPLEQLPPNLSRTSLAFSANGRFLACWDIDTPIVSVWDLRTGLRHRELIAKTTDSAKGSRVSLAWSPDCRVIAVSGLVSDYAIQLWEVATAKVRRQFEGHAAGVESLAFSPDGRLLASGSEDTTVLIWDVFGFAGR